MPPAIACAPELIVQAARRLVGAGCTPTHPADLRFMDFLYVWIGEQLSAAGLPPDAPLCDAPSVPKPFDAASVGGTLAAGAVPRRLAFRGNMGSGKSTAVASLIERFGGTEVSFAAPLYELLHYAQALCGLPPRKDRSFLQYAGTDHGRVVEENVWVRLAFERIAAYERVGNVYVSDARFPNELAALESHGFTTVHVTRRAADTPTREALGNGSASHASEHALDGIACMRTIANDGTRAELGDALAELYNSKAGETATTMAKLETLATMHQQYAAAAGAKMEAVSAYKEYVRMYCVGRSYDCVEALGGYELYRKKEDAERLCSELETKIVAVRRLSDAERHEAETLGLPVLLERLNAARITVDKASRDCGAARRRLDASMAAVTTDADKEAVFTNALAFESLNAAYIQALGERLVAEAQYECRCLVERL